MARQAVPPGKLAFLMLVLLLVTEFQNTRTA
jgi:hypothetical protein